MKWKKHEMMKGLTAAGLAEAISTRLPEGQKPMTGVELLNVIAFDVIVEAIAKQVMYLRGEGEVAE